MSVRTVLGYAVAIFAALTGVPVTAAVSPQQGSVRLDNCELSRIARPARCGAITVPEDWEAPNGREISIALAVVPARKPDLKRDPIVVLMGGPGESAIEDASIYVNWLAPVLDDRDLVLVDQCGSGSSAP